MVLHIKYGDKYKYEIGVDEAGKGPMFGRVYSAAVILNDIENIRSDLIKDSKKFTSPKKIKEAYDYIKENSYAYSVCYEEPGVIDKINIREATLSCMHNAVMNVLNQSDNDEEKLILVDGNDFKPLFRNEKGRFYTIPHVTVIGGDNTYYSIAAASILAKVERDAYIADLCEKNEALVDKYDLLSNKGYGTKKHMNGIKEYGITDLHRKSYGICKELDVMMELTK
jgi:ribonuclease HII